MEVLCESLVGGDVHECGREEDGGQVAVELDGGGGTVPLSGLPESISLFFTRTQPDTGYGRESLTQSAYTEPVSNPTHRQTNPAKHAPALSLLYLCS